MSLRLPPLTAYCTAFTNHCRGSAADAHRCVGAAVCAHRCAGAAVGMEPCHETGYSLTVTDNVIEEADLKTTFTQHMGPLNID